MNPSPADGAQVRRDVAAVGDFAVVGDPIAHSLSPRLFRLAFEKLGIRASYRAKRIGADGLAELLARMRAGELRGLSVTLPHKVAIAARLDALSPLATRCGAVNCVAIEGARLVGHNTDVAGIVRSLGGVSPTLRQVLILGAGGAARAAVLAARELAPRAEVTIANRTPDAAKRLAALIEGARAAPLDDALAAIAARAELVINATSVGQGTDANPLPDRCVLHAGQRVLDLVYRPLQTALLRRARDAGAEGVDGLHVLVHQALAQLAIWTGIEADASLAEHLHAALAPEAA